jgi:hypothetical protein
VVCRYGVPQWVRTDRGSEFKADFEAYCASSGIIIRKISAITQEQMGRLNDTVGLSPVE